MESQEHRNQQYAEENSFIVEKVFHDNVTGGGDFNKRPVMTQIINCRKLNPHQNYVLMFDYIKHFSRNIKKLRASLCYQAWALLGIFLTDTTTDNQLIFRVFSRIVMV